MKRILFLLFSLIAITSQAQVSLGGYIQPLNNSSYPVQIDSLGKGGYMVARDTTERNNISCLRRKYGMAVYSQAQQKLYILKDSNCINTWVEFSGSAYINTTQINDTSYYISRSDGTKDTFLFTGGGSGGGGGAVGNLQQVTDSGSTTTNAIKIISDIPNNIGTPNKLHLVEKDNLTYDSAYIDFNTPDYSISDPFLTNIKIKQENASVDMGISAYNSSFINYDPYMNIKNSINTFSVNPRGFSILTSNKVFQINDDYFYFIKQSPNTQFYLKPLYSDSTRFHTLYTSKFDTTQVVDTIATLRDVRAGGGSGVTSVGSGYGIANSPTTITSTGSVIVDTSISGLSGKYLRIIDTTEMLSRYLRKTDTASLSNRINLKIDSLKKSNDSIYAYKNGSRTFAYKDSVGITSVGLSMPTAFSVTNSPVTTSGTIAVTGAGVVSQYIRGDGSLANFPTSTGGGSSVSYYLNGSVSQGTIGGVAFREMNKTPIIGAGTDFTINADGYIQSFITDAGDPALLNIPTGNWNFEMYFSASSGGGSPRFYLELYKWDGTTLSLISSNSATPEYITGGTAIDLYTTALAVPTTTLLATDRLAVRVYVIHSGRTITLHTEDSHLCQVITTFSSGLTALNGLTEQVQNFATGTSGTDFGISSASATHTFNLPTASATNRGALSTSDWSTFNGKIGAGDTAAMLTPYLRKVDTTAMLAPYLRKVDTTAMLLPYLRKVDTSAFQRKSLASYTFMANNTTATANATAQTFKDSGLKVYNGSITFTPVAPSGATNNTYRWSQIGKLVTVRINLLYATASGATLTTLVASLPSDCPAPEIPTGFSGASTTICPAFGYLFTSSTSSPTTLAATIGFLRSNSGNNGYEIVLIRAAGSVAAAYITLTYFAQ